MSRKNEAALTHKNAGILIWQDVNLNWVYSIDGAPEVSSQSKELQTALNLAFESVDEKVEGPISRLLQRVKEAADTKSKKKTVSKKPGKARKATAK